MSDQFLAMAAKFYGRLQLDSPLQRLLEENIIEIQRIIEIKSGRPLAFYTNVRNLLVDLSKAANSTVQTVSVCVRVCHPANKRMPFKKKLVIEESDSVRFDGTGNPGVNLFQVCFQDCDESLEVFNNDLKNEFAKTALWMSKQAPTVFQELRDAGFATKLFVFITEQNRNNSVSITVPTDVVAESGRLGLSIKFVTLLSAASE